VGKVEFLSVRIVESILWAWACLFALLFTGAEYSWVFSFLYIQGFDFIKDLGVLD